MLNIYIYIQDSFLDMNHRNMKQLSSNKTRFLLFMGVRSPIIDDISN